MADRIIKVDGGGRTIVTPGTDLLAPFALAAQSALDQINSFTTGPAGPASAGRINLAALKAAATTDRFSLYDGSLWAWETANAPYTADDINIVKADSTALTVGAWVRQSAAGVVTRALVASPVSRSTEAKLQEIAVAPEDKGGIQLAIDAVTASASTGAGTHAPVQLRQFSRYTLSATITLDTLRVSLGGNSTIDATAITANTAALTVACSVGGEFGNSYGFKGRLTDFRLKGTGQTGTLIGIDFNSTTSNSASQALVENVAIWGFKTAVKFSNHAYNSVFTKLDVSNCDVCIHWPAGGMDNNERNTFVGATIYNSNVGILNENADGTIYQIAGSLDYLKTAAKAVNGAKVALTDMHLESSVWGTGTDPYGLYASGSGGSIVMQGGLLLNTSSAAMVGSSFAYVGAGARILLDKLIVHNLTLTRANANTPTAFFDGPGAGILTNTHGFDGAFAARPDRINAAYTQLSDPSFESAAWEDLVWINAVSNPGTNPINSRVTNAEITITKVTSSMGAGTKALSAGKTFGAGTVASFGLMRLPVRWGEKVMAGLHYASADSTARAFEIQWLWAKFDRFHPHGLPIWSRTTSLGLNHSPTAGTITKMAVLGKVLDTADQNSTLSQLTVPAWATDLICIVNMFSSPAGAILFDDLWADSW